METFIWLIFDYKSTFFFSYMQEKSATFCKIAQKSALGSTRCAGNERKNAVLAETTTLLTKTAKNFRREGTGYTSRGYEPRKINTNERRGEEGLIIGIAHRGGVGMRPVLEVLGRVGCKIPFRFQTSHLAADK